MKVRFILLILIFLFCLSSCKQNQVRGVIIESDLYTTLDYKRNKELILLIDKTLDKDQNALAKLNKFWCGGGAGCYDLGFIFTQIIYQIGEEEFILMVDKLNPKQCAGINGLISAGLEYGDNNNDGEMDDSEIKIEFPKLLAVLQFKNSKLTLSKSIE